MHKIILAVSFIIIIAGFNKTLAQPTIEWDAAVTEVRNRFQVPTEHASTVLGLIQVEMQFRSTNDSEAADLLLRLVRGLIILDQAEEQMRVLPPLVEGVVKGGPTKGPLDTNARALITRGNLGVFEIVTTVEELNLLFLARTRTCYQEGGRQCGKYFELAKEFSSSTTRLVRAVLNNRSGIFVPSDP
jgi:hypothetical protein